MTAHDEPPRVRYEKRGQVAYVTLDRPAVLNAMDARMHAELAEVWDDFEADDGLRVAVLTGAGDRSFSVGRDLKELAKRVGGTGGGRPDLAEAGGKDTSALKSALQTLPSLIEPLV